MVNLIFYICVVLISFFIAWLIWWCDANLPRIRWLHRYNRLRKTIKPKITYYPNSELIRSWKAYDTYIKSIREYTEGGELKCQENQEFIEISG